MKQKFFSKKFLAKIFIMQAFCLLFLAFMPMKAYGAEPEKSFWETFTKFEQHIIIPGQGSAYTEVGADTMAKYISAWYKFAIAAIGVLATVMIMAGGFIWLTAGGNQSQISTAKDWITGAFSGMVIALLSYTVLEILNPGLVNLKTLNVGMVRIVESAGFCCDKSTGQSSDLVEGKCGGHDLCKIQEVCKKTDGCKVLNNGDPCKKPGDCAVGWFCTDFYGCQQGLYNSPCNDKSQCKEQNGNQMYCQSLPQNVAKFMRCYQGRINDPCSGVDSCLDGFICSGSVPNQWCTKKN